MPIREIVGKTIGFGVTSLSLIAGGILAWIGPHPYNDYLNTTLAAVLVLMGLGAGGVGTLIIGGIIYDARLRQREAEVHITPRDGPPDLPPAWGMGNIGRPETGAGGPAGGGTTRVMSVAVTNWDAPVVIGLLVVWTVVGLLLLAPR